LFLLCELTFKLCFPASFAACRDHMTNSDQWDLGGSNVSHLHAWLISHKGSSILSSYPPGSSMLTWWTKMIMKQWDGRAARQNRPGAPSQSLEKDLYACEVSKRILCCLKVWRFVSAVHLVWQPTGMPYLLNKICEVNCP
jgi:hypothetical protein